MMEVSLISIWIYECVCVCVWLIHSSSTAVLFLEWFRYFSVHLAINWVSPTVNWQLYIWRTLLACFKNIKYVCMPNNKNIICKPSFLFCFPNFEVMFMLCFIFIALNQSLLQTQCECDVMVYCVTFDIIFVCFHKACFMMACNHTAFWHLFSFS